MSELIPPAHLWFPGMLAMLGLTLASGFFSASETALFYLSHDDLRQLRVGKPRERAAAALLSDPDRLLTAVLFWNLLINLVYFAASVVVAQKLVDANYSAAAGAFSLGSLFGIILFGEVLPKSVAVVFRHQLASLVSWPLAFAVRVLDPITPGLTNVARLVRRAFWPQFIREPHLQAEDLERAVEASQLGEEIIRQERQVLHNILDLSEITVEEVMRPRGTYIALPSPVRLADLKGRVPASDYLVIQQNGSDAVDRAVRLTNFSSIPTENLETAAEEVVHVPWCADLAYTLQLLRGRFCGLASVVNEYGETIGIVTYEDIVDTVMMPEPSRAKRLLRREPVLEIAPGRYHVEGITTLRYLSKRLNISFAPIVDGLVTVAGMLHDELEHLPNIGDECSWRGCRIKVIDVSRRGKLRVMVSREQK